MKSKTIPQIFIALLSVASSLPTVAKAEATKRIIPHAIHARISSRGEKYFQAPGNVQKLINTASTSDLTYGSFQEGEKKWRAGAIYNITAEGVFTAPAEGSDSGESRQVLSAAQGAVLHRVVSALRDWLEIEVGRVQPTIVLGRSQYEAKIQNIALSTDIVKLKDLEENLKWPEGIVLKLDLQLQEVVFGSDSLKIFDKNTDLDTFGIQNGWAVTLKAPAKPISIQVPFYLSLNSDGTVRFRAFQVQQTVASAQLDFSYGELILPEIGPYTYNGRPKNFVLKKNFDKMIAADRPRIANQLRSLLEAYVRTSLPDFLGKKINTLLRDKLRAPMKMALIAAPDGDAKIEWGLRVDKIYQNPWVEIAMSAYAEDREAPQSVEILADHKVLLPTQEEIAPQLADMSADQYDVALALHKAFINRMLQLSWERGERAFNAARLEGKKPVNSYMRAIEFTTLDSVGKKVEKQLEVLEPPTIEYFADFGSPRPEEGVRIAIHLYLKTPSGTVAPGFLRVNRLGIADAFRMRVRVIALVKKNPSGPGLVLQKDSIELLEINESDLRVAGAAANNSVKQALAGISKEWREKEAYFTKNPIPLQSILGMEFDLAGLGMSPSGYMNIYLNHK